MVATHLKQIPSKYAFTATVKLSASLKHLISPYAPCEPN